MEADPKGQLLFFLWRGEKFRRVDEAKRNSGGSESAKVGHEPVLVERGCIEMSIEGSVRESESRNLNLIGAAVIKTDSHAPELSIAEIQNDRTDAAAVGNSFRQKVYGMTFDSAEDGGIRRLQAERTFKIRKDAGRIGGRAGSIRLFHNDLTGLPVNRPPQIAVTPDLNIKNINDI